MVAIFLFFKGRSWPPLRMLFLIFVISGEQLSLNVAGDSAKTLSVLGNIGDALDDCGLRFVQKCRRPPQNTPDFGGLTDFFSKSCLLNHHPELAPPGLPDHPGGPGGFFMIYQYPNHPAVALTGLLELRLEFNSQNKINVR